MVTTITEDNAMDLVWQPMQLMYVSSGVWVTIPDNVSAGDFVPVLNIEVGVDAALFGKPDVILCECIVAEYGVLYMFGAAAESSSVESAAKGFVAAKFFSETEVSNYLLPYRVRSDVD